jgi:hypothetical protein
VIVTSKRSRTAQAIASESRSAWNAVSKFKDFMASDAGALARYQQRRRRRVHFTIDDIEPQSKKMPDADRDTFQAAVAQQLTFAKRGTFRGDVALKLNLATTRRNAPQAHTIAKNLLDLLSQRRLGVEWPQHHLLYKGRSTDPGAVRVLPSRRRPSQHPHRG